MNITDIIEVKANPKIPPIIAGDTVKVRQKVKEGDKTRIQVFQGVVIRVHQSGPGTNFTVRRVTSGVGVERTFPIYSPMIDGVEVVRHGKVRRSRLYYLRGLSARASRIKERRLEKQSEESAPVGVTPETEAALDVEQPAATAPAEAVPAAEAPPAEAPAAAEPQAEAPRAEEPQAEAPAEENKQSG